MNKALQTVHQLNLNLASEQENYRQLSLACMQAKQRIAQAKFELDNAVMQLKSQNR